MKKRFTDGPPLLNPVTDMHIKDDVFLDSVRQIETYEQRLYAHPLHKSDDLQTIYAQYLKKVEVSLILNYR